MSAVLESSAEDDAQLQYVPVANIRPKDNFNPRTYFDETGFAELKASVAEHGVLQPIVIRPCPEAEGRYWIVVGERRWRAARETGQEEIPAVIRSLSDKQALAMAMVENTVRADMSPAEEARAARRIISTVDGDRAEARRVLGWSQHKLDQRLLLLHAAQSVLDALSRRQIKVGHAELLATLPETTQQGTLEQIIEQQIPVTALKAKIDSFALELHTAIFDRSGCRNCPHNSSTQQSLFEETISQGRCLNRSCFWAKTQAALEVKKAELEEEHNAVFFDSEKAPETYTVLQQSGPEGVGAKQFAQCAGCKDFGCVLSTRPGEAGEVTEGLCFNLVCNKDKVESYQAQVRSLQAQPEAVPTSATSDSAGGGVQQASVGTASSGESKASVKANPKRVNEQAQRVVRDAARAIARQDANAARAVVLSTLVADNSLPSERSRGLSGKRREDALRHAYEMSREDQNRVLAAVVDHVLARTNSRHDFSEMDPLSVKLSRTLLNMTGSHISEHFELDEDFLKAHTKDGIRALMTEAGFDRWYCDQEGSDTAFDKLMNRKTAEIIDTILNRGEHKREQGFDFSGFVPNVVQTTLKTG